MITFLRGLCLLCTTFTFISCATISTHPLLDRSDARQVIEVKPSSTQIFKGTLTAWTQDRGIWKKALGPWPVVIGRNGFAPINEKKEGDGRTPSGTYPLKTAFGKEAGLTTGLNYRQTTADDLWVDDITSPQYNQWVKAPTEAKSYEQMLRADGLYDLGAVIEYNTDPVVPGNGSAIFIHIWRDNGQKPTAGCVALNKDKLRRLLTWLNTDRVPVIVLGTSP